MRQPARFDLNLLRIFDAIYTKGGVSAAARHLNLSQPAISHALTRLRGHFDDQLFVRQGNRLVPTSAARAIAGSVGDALRELDNAFDAATSFDPSAATRDFRIGVRLAGEMPRFASLVSRVRREAPHVSLASVTFRRRDLLTALAQGDLDLALDVALAPDDRLQRHYLGTEPLVVAVRIGHPGVNGAIDLATYLALDHVVATVRTHGPGIEDFALEHMGLSRRVAVRCQNAVTAWQIIATTDMAFSLPRSQADILQAVWPMQLVDLPLTVDQGGRYLYWHQAAQADPALSWLRAIIVEELSHGS